MEHESRNIKYMFVKEFRLGQFYAYVSVSLGVVNSSWCNIEIQG